VVRVRIYVEGGGDGKHQHIQCRMGFRKLFERAGFIGRMPATIAGGARGTTYDMFRTALASSSPDNHPILLVDSEDPVIAPVAWEHLLSRDGWERPVGAADDQAQLMVTCMETWIMADPAALRRAFGSQLQTSALLPQSDLEERPHDEVQDALEHATRNCGRDKAYAKGRRSFKVLAELDPQALRQYLPHFQQLIETLDRLLG
jgi:hypothetical protein